MSTIITATEVTVRYGERAVLNAATLAIDEGDRIGLVGRNGCGKTTFLRLLAGLQAPDIGEVSRWREAGEILQENIRRFPSEIVAHEERLMGILKDLAQANEIPPSDEDHVPHAVVEKMNIGDADRATAEAEWVLGIAEMTISVVGHRAPAASAR